MADADDRLKQLLKNAFQDEGLRRMARRAGVHATSQKQTDSVNWALRKIGEQILDTMCEKMAIYTENRKSTTVSDQDFRSACDFLKIRASFYAVPGRDDGRFPRCKSYSPGGRGSKRKRGKKAELEARHENKQDSCLYNETAPFTRLVREIMMRHHANLRFTPPALSATQYVVEQLLINILQAAGKVVEDTTVGPRGGSPRATLSYRDIAAVVNTLKIFPNCMPVLGNSDAAREAGRQPPAPGDGDDGGRGGRGRGSGRGRGRSRGDGRGRGSGDGKGRGGALAEELVGAAGSAKDLHGEAMEEAEKSRSEWPK